MKLEDVKDLIKFDQDTVLSVKNIYDKKASVLKEIAMEKEALASKSWAEVEEKIKLRKAELDKKIAEDVKINDEYYEKMALELKTSFKENKDKWEEDLFSRCIK